MRSSNATNWAPLVTVMRSDLRFLNLKLWYGGKANQVAGKPKPPRQQSHQEIRNPSPRLGASQTHLWRRWLVVQNLRGVTSALVKGCPGRIRTCDTGFRRACKPSRWWYRKVFSTGDITPSGTNRNHGVSRIHRPSTDHGWASASGFGNEEALEWLAAFRRARAVS
jgi:hypothetical protein